MCVNYGGRDEILRAARAYARDYKETGADLTEALFFNIYVLGGTAGPLILSSGPAERCGCQIFCCGSLPMPEFYFTDVLWPDFNARELDRAIIAYQARDRRYGGVKGQGK